MHPIQQGFRNNGDAIVIPPQVETHHLPCPEGGTLAGSGGEMNNTHISGVIVLLVGWMVLCVSISMSCLEMSGVVPTFDTF